MMLINDSFRVWTRSEDIDSETEVMLQEFIRGYLTNVQTELCARIKQDFSITCFAMGVKDGAK